jgi:glycosyltransferase involved in cell wall biosynthesis
VRTYGAGVVVKGCPGGIAVGLQLLIEAPSARYVAARRGARQLVEDHYTWAKVIGQMAHMYQEVISMQAHS